MNAKRIQPKDVDGFSDLKYLAQTLCDEPNNVDGILILCPKNDEPIFLEACTEQNFQGVDNIALGGRILEVIKFSSDLVISHQDFSPGNIKSIVYEFDDLVFVIYNVRGENLQDVYLILVNTKDKDLGAFNANRGRVRAQMEVGIKRVLLLK